jgi:hypothetical protein
MPIPADNFRVAVAVLTIAGEWAGAAILTMVFDWLMLRRAITPSRPFLQMPIRMVVASGTSMDPS